MTPDKNHRAGIDHVFVGILRSGAVRGFEDGVAVADVRAGSNSQSADLRRAGVGNVVAIQIRAWPSTEYSSARVTTCWKIESAMRSLIMIFFFHAPLPCVT